MRRVEAGVVVGEHVGMLDAADEDELRGTAATREVLQVGTRGRVGHPPQLPGESAPPGTAAASVRNCSIFK